VLPIQGVADAIVLRNVLRVVNERGRCVLVSAAKQPLEKAWVLKSHFGVWQNPSVRRGRLCRADYVEKKREPQAWDRLRTIRRG
jgi:hypothetical protein